MERKAEEKAADEAIKRVQDLHMEDAPLDSLSILCAGGPHKVDIVWGGQGLVMVNVTRQVAQDFFYQGWKSLPKTQKLLDSVNKKRMWRLMERTRTRIIASFYDKYGAPPPYFGGLMYGTPANIPEEEPILSYHEGPDTPVITQHGFIRELSQVCDGCNRFARHRCSGCRFQYCSVQCCLAYPQRHWLPCPKFAKSLDEGAKKEWKAKQEKKEKDPKVKQLKKMKLVQQKEIHFLFNQMLKEFVSENQAHASSLDLPYSDWLKEAKQLHGEMTDYVMEPMSQEQYAKYQARAVMYNPSPTIRAKLTQFFKEKEKETKVLAPDSSAPKENSNPIKEEKIPAIIPTQPLEVVKSSLDKIDSGSSILSENPKPCKTEDSMWKEVEQLSLADPPLEKDPQKEIRKQYPTHAGKTVKEMLDGKQKRSNQGPWEPECPHLLRFNRRQDLENEIEKQAENDIAFSRMTDGQGSLYNEIFHQDSQELEFPYQKLKSEESPTSAEVWINGHRHA